ncbi:MAG: hypothetical protein GX216_06670 [Methanomicrobiales archaeon]|nr:hypothetical protein [Methanomicrobiales archaeon]
MVLVRHGDKTRARPGRGYGDEPGCPVDHSVRTPALIPAAWVHPLLRDF